jgi:cyclohexadieny/prephenate dehydrogenase
VSARPLIERLALVGLGLIGSSLARAVRRGNLTKTLVAFDANPDVRDRAAALGLADVVTNSATDAVIDADLVILCVPVGAMAAVAKSLAPALKPGAIVSDVGSVKSAVAQVFRDCLPAHVHAIPAHPVAGTEKSGPDAGFASLFDNRWCILTPPANADPEALARLSAFWTALGANVDVMDADHHDRVLAVTSHIPHLIAYTIVGTADDIEQVTQSEVIKYSAGGFRDFTRIAASDPTMWRDVFLNNREAVLDVLQRFSEDLSAMQRAIRWGDGDALFDLFTRTRAIRRSIIEAGQDTAAEDFGRPHGNENSDHLPR